MSQAVLFGITGRGGAQTALASFPLMLLSTVFAASAATAGTYYVSPAPAGNDGNDGLSLATPWLTIQHAADVVGPGDTVKVQPGTYAEQIVIHRPGLSNACVSFEGEGKPHLVASGNTVLVYADWIKISGLRVEATSGTAIVLDDPADNRLEGITFADNEIVSRGGPGLEFNNRASVEFHDITVENNVFRSTLFDATGDVPIFGPRNVSSGYNIIIRYNKVDDAGWNGLGIGRMFNGTVVEGNEVTGLVEHNLIDLHDTHHAIIKNNYLHDVNVPGTTSLQNGFYIDGTNNLGLSGNLTLLNNTVRDISCTGIQLISSPNNLIRNLFVANTLNSSAMSIFTDPSVGDQSYADNLTVWGFVTRGNYREAVYAYRTATGGVFRFIDLNVTVGSGGQCGPTNKICFEEIDSSIWHFVNAKDMTYGWYGGSMKRNTIHEYAYVDVLVRDETGHAVPGASVSFESTDRLVPAVNLDSLSPISVTLTGADGHTALPSDTARTVAIPWRTVTSSGTTRHSWNIVAEAAGGGRRCSAVGVNPDQNWYRPDPMVASCTLEITLADPCGAAAVVCHAYGAIAGTVRSGGRPLEGATVSDGLHSTASDSDGRFVLSPLDPGHFVVSASKDGFEGRSQDADLPAADIVVLEFELPAVSTGARNPLGTACTAATDCLSGNCVPGPATKVCCASPCTESCDAGTCSSDGASCDPRTCPAPVNACQLGACDPVSGCNAASGTGCDDAHACTTNDTCDGSGTCMGGENVCPNPDPNPDPNSEPSPSSDVNPDSGPSSDPPALSEPGARAVGCSCAGGSPQSSGLMLLVLAGAVALRRR